MARTHAHSLYGTSNESSCVPDALLRGTFLADALVEWECYQQKPLENGPLVLRFETCDVSFSAEAGMLSLAAGPVDTRACPAGPNTCATWIPDASLASALGQKVLGAARLTPSSFEVHLEECCILIKAQDGHVASSISLCSG